MEWDAEKYSKNSQMQFKLGMQAIDLLNPQGSEKVLDIGCGTGSLDLEIARKLDSGTILGVEPDASMIALARQAIEQNGTTNFSVIQANATELDFQEEFDAVFSNFVIHWIKNTQKLFRVLHAALKPGGRLVIAAGYVDKNFEFIPEETATRKAAIGRAEYSIFSRLAADGYSPFLDIVPAVELQACIAKFSAPYNLHGLKELQRFLEKAGFQDIQLDAHVFLNEFETLDAYMDYQEESGSPWLVILSSFPAKYRENLQLCLRELLQAAWEEIPEEQKEYPIKERWPVVFMQAKKA